MSEETHESVPASGRKTSGSAALARRRLSAFTIVTMIAGVIAMSLIVWRIGKAWKIEYGSGPREARPIPTTGSFGAPGDLVTPRGPASATTSR